MVMTREQNWAAMAHILDVVLNLFPDSPVHRALLKTAIFVGIHFLLFEILRYMFFEDVECTNNVSKNMCKK